MLQRMCFRWIEVWDRKRRQYLCDSVLGVRNYLNDRSYACMQAPDDLRVTICHNKANRSLIEVLKTDLECGWSFAGRISGEFYVILLFVVMLVEVA